CSGVAAAWSGQASRIVAGAFSGAALLFAVLGPKWNLAELTSGANVYFEGPKTTQELVSIREDVQGGVTTVTLSEGVHTLFTNGKFQGNTGWEMQAQRLFAHYPCLFVQNFDQALVIGLGTGTTLGTLAAYPFKKLYVAEISPGIVEAAGKYFRAPNRDALRDPRVELSLSDGRNYLLLSERKYDLIGMELSSIWFAGASNLYSREFYELVRSHLEPDGIFQQWVQLHHVYQRDFATVVNTLRRVFPHVTLFYGGGQGILVASLRPQRASESRLAQLESTRDLRAVEPLGRSLPELLDDVLVRDQEIDAFLASISTEIGVPLEKLVSTDENLYLEYATPRGNVLPWSTREALVERLRSHHSAASTSALLVP
ncbi:MAG TPA: fused MFS/spermidine synthase, partial [Polyangiaceae bacterium]|nr:fused MFS/spermidine synthase [Polyangiaceae bacterium]